MHYHIKCKETPCKYISIHECKRLKRTLKLACYSVQPNFDPIKNPDAASVGWDISFRTYNCIKN